MGFVDEQDGRPGGGLHFIDHALQAALELTLDTGPRLQETEVEAQKVDALQRCGHFATGDAQGQAFHHCGFTDPGFAHHDGIVLSAPGEDVDHLADGGVAAQHGVQLAFASLASEVVSEAGQCRCAAARGICAWRGALR
ncbi:hypothetical protein D9M68_624270 [compost metagenome]